MKKALVVMALLSGATYATVRWFSSDAPAVTESLAQDRLWIDHMPKSDRDVVQVFAALTEEPVGAFFAGSQWKSQQELFVYEAHGRELRLRYPQTGEKERVRAIARRCDEQGMDYCLELSGNTRGVQRYYSLEGWELGGRMTQQQLEDRIEQLVRSR